MGHDVRERFRVLYLNARNELLLDDETAVGTVDAAPIYARDIIGRGIEVGAVSLLLVHNHPSGDCQPSRQDVAMTLALADLCTGVAMTLVDHLVVGRDEIHSLRALGLLDR